jgi:hypothetical protein
MTSLLLMPTAASTSACCSAAARLLDRLTATSSIARSSDKNLPPMVWRTQRD